jgi:hypothetical protein
MWVNIKILWISLIPPFKIGRFSVDNRRYPQNTVDIVVNKFNFQKNNKG